eukprot:15364523-Ditylum_brightwellii.AAC.1
MSFMTTGSTLKSTEFIQDDLHEEENENAKNHDSVVHTPEHIDGQGGKETIHYPNYHNEDVGDTPDHIDGQEAKVIIDDTSNDAETVGGSPVNNTDITQQEENDGNDKTETADNNNDEDAYVISGNNSTGNNTDLPLDENFEVNTDRSVENKVETNVARKHRIDKKTLFGLSSSSSSSESSEEEHVVDAGEELQRIIDCFPVQKNISEKPHGIDCVNAAVGDWKQRSTEATQATLNSVRVKEEPTVPKDALVQNTEGTSYKNVICVDDSDDDKACSPQPSVVGSGAVQNWYSGVADMVEVQTKEYFVIMLWEMQANKSSAGMGNMCSQLLRRLQMEENTTDDNKMNAKSDSGDKRMPAK